MKELRYREYKWKQLRSGSWFCERGDYTLRVEAVKNGYWWRLYYDGRPIWPIREPNEGSMVKAMRACEKAHLSHYCTL